jgi:hypothetical protein
MATDWVEGRCGSRVVPEGGRCGRRVVPEGRPKRLSGQNPKVEHERTSPNFALLLSREPLIGRSYSLVVPRRKPW